MKDPQTPGKRSRGRPEGYSPKTGKIHPPPPQQEQEQPATAEMQAQYKVRRNLAILCSFKGCMHTILERKRIFSLIFVAAQCDY